MRPRAVARSASRIYIPAASPSQSAVRPAWYILGMGPSNLVLDIETVPDPDLYTPPDTRMGEERPFPPLYVHKPIVIGCLLFDDRYRLVKFGDFGAEGSDERAMLEKFAGYVGRKRVHIVTFNGRGFDLPVIALRCLRHGISLPWYYQPRSDYRYRYSDEGHLDLCDFLTEHGAAARAGLSLDAAARVIGLPGKTVIDGSQVEGLYHAGQLQQIRDYCLHDVVQTAFLLLRFRLLQGHLDRAHYREVAGALLAAIEKDGRFAQMLALCDRARLLLTQAG